MSDDLLVVPVHEADGVRYEMVMQTRNDHGYANASKRVIGELFTKSGVCTSRVNGTHVEHESRTVAIQYMRAIAALDD